MPGKANPSEKRILAVPLPGGPVLSAGAIEYGYEVLTVIPPSPSLFGQLLEHLAAAARSGSPRLQPSHERAKLLVDASPGRLESLRKAPEPLPLQLQSVDVPKYVPETQILIKGRGEVPG